MGTLETVAAVGLDVVVWAGAVLAVVRVVRLFAGLIGDIRQMWHGDDR